MVSLHFYKEFVQAVDDYSGMLFEYDLYPFNFDYGCTLNIRTKTKATALIKANLIETVRLLNPDVKIVNVYFNEVVF